MENLTPEQKQQIQMDNQARVAFLQAFESLYKNMSDFLQKLNINPQIKAFSFMNFDQGAFWAREGIRTLILSVPPSPPAPTQPEDEKKEEKPQEDSKPQQESQPQDAA